MQKSPEKSKLKVAVLMGGISSERNISLKSGRAVTKALRRRGHTVEAIDIKEKDINNVKSWNPDVAFIALHGEFGEDGQVQALLEDASIPYTGSGVSASRAGMDKKASKRLYIQHAVPTPSYALINTTTSLSNVVHRAEEIGFPVVCKPPMGGSSINVRIAHDAGSLLDFYEAWRKSNHNSPEGELILEKHIHGREMTVGIIDGMPLPIIEIKSRRDFFDYRAKYEDENTIYQLPVSLIESVYRKICDTALRAYRATGCRHLARADVIYSYFGDIYVLELNTIPGLTSRSLLPMAASYCGIDFPCLCEKICRLPLSFQEGKVYRNAG